MQSNTMNNLIEDISQYISKLFDKRLPASFLYHNIRHTKDVVYTSSVIAEKSGLDNDDTELLLIAAWFHDTGYTESIEYHEEKSARIAEEFLTGRNVPQEKISVVTRAILSTKIPQRPGNDIEKILCDADLAYMGSSDFIEKIKLLREEWSLTLNKTYTDYEWLIASMNFIESNSFHTESAHKIFEGKRKENLALLQQMIDKQNAL
jgi:predicted metal-dependent HD superfamily phosphohydrolase